MTTPARPGSFTGATDNASNGGLFTDTLIDGIPDIVGADVARAETAATNAETSASGAATSATNAATSETNASASATSASTSSANAATSATNAATSASTTAADAATATTKAGEAATSATNAASSETAAAGSATSASSSATSATSSANTAVTSASAAGTSETNAATSATNSANSATASASSASASASSATASANSATASQTAQTAAELAETNAETAETNAETAETGAATSATNAANSASAASTSATNSATSATNSANSATASATSATASATSATAAAASEAAAAGYVDNFDDKYLGAKTSDPTVDNDGDPLTDGALYYNTTDNRMKVYDLGTTTWLLLAPTNAEQININTVANDITNVNTVANNTSNINAVAADATDIGVVATNISNVNTVATNNANVNTVATNITDVNSFADTYSISATAPASPTTGDLWFDTTNSIMKVYDGSGFVNAGSSVNGTSARYDYTATAGQTTFAAVYDTGYVDVYLNGVKLAPTDFTATNGSTIVLTTGAALNDTVGIVGYGTFSVASAVTLPDNVKATFGDSSDLEIYHDSSASYIVDSGTGSLNIHGTDINLRDADGNSYINMSDNGTGGTVTLRHNTAVKLNTKTDGILITGELQADSLDINGSGDISGNLSFADNGKAIFGAGSDLQIYHSGTHSFIDDAGIGNLYIRSSDMRLQKYTGENMIVATADAAVTLYYDNAAKIATTATGIDVTGNIDFSGGILRSNSSVQFVMDADNNGGEVFVWGHNASNATTNELMRLTSAGSLGIGTAPAGGVQLDVRGTGVLQLVNTDTVQLLASNGGSTLKNVSNNPLIFGTNNTERMRILSDGKVAIGSTASSEKLRVSGNIEVYNDDVDGYIWFHDAGTRSWSVGSDQSTGNFVVTNVQGIASGQQLSLDGSGNLTATGNVTAFSDERLKSDITTIDNALDKVTAMRGVTFTKDGEANSGVIAQELEKIAPELVMEGEEYKSVAYGNLVGYLIEAVKELSAKVEELENASSK